MTDELPVSPHCRVIVDNDYQGDPDGLVALAHHLVSRRDDDLPLYLACGGPLTNVASALRDAPDIALRLTLIWIGGSLDRSAFEYNRDTDRQAAEFVFEQPELEIHQFPVETYRRCAYSVAELEYDLSSSGALGHWLWSRFTNPPDWVRIGGVWPLADSPAVLVTALSAESSTATLLPAGGSRVRNAASTPTWTSASSSPTCSPGSGCTSARGAVGSLIR